MTRKPSIARFAYRLSSLSAQIESLEARATAMDLPEIAKQLRHAKEAAMEADRLAYRAANEAASAPYEL